MAIDYLIRRGTIWHCRLDIPKDIRASFGNRKILSKSLRTGDKLLARELAAKQVGLWKQEFREARDAKLAMGDVWREDLSTQVQMLNERIEPRLLKSVKLKSSLSKLSDDEAIKLFETTLLKMQGIHTTLSAYASSIGYPSFSEEWAIIHQTRDVVEQNTLIFKLFTQLTTYAKKQQYQLNATELEEAQDIASNPTIYKPKSPISSASIKLFEQHLNTQLDNRSTKSQLLSKVESFSRYLTLEGREISFDTVADYLDSVSSKRQTRQTHLWAIRKWHDWGIRYDKYYRELLKDTPSPYDKHSHPRIGPNSGESWIPYTRQEVELLYNAALNKPRGADIELASLIKFAAYTGSRIEEIGRITKQTTVFEDGLPIAFNIEDAKTQAGIRTVPIHSQLLPLYTTLLSQTDDYLFKGKMLKSGLRLNAPQNRFTPLKRSLGFTDRHVFHSFRGAVVSALEQADVNYLVITSIIGHKRGSLAADTYSAGASFQQKKDAIERLHYDF